MGDGREIPYWKLYWNEVWVGFRHFASERWKWAAALQVVGIVRILILPGRQPVSEWVIGIAVLLSLYLLFGLAASIIGTPARIHSATKEEARNWKEAATTARDELAKRQEGLRDLVLRAIDELTNNLGLPHEPLGWQGLRTASTESVERLGREPLDDEVREAVSRVTACARQVREASTSGQLKTVWDSRFAPAATDLLERLKAIADKDTAIG